LIAALVLAAGQSSRMGRPKMVLPWGKTTVIGQVVTTLVGAGLDEIVVVTGNDWDRVQIALDAWIRMGSVRLVHNARYTEGDMLRSTQVGLKSLLKDHEAAMIVLGDQPQMEIRVVKQVIAAYQAHQPLFVVPSYQMRRGHPWMISREIWPEIFSLQSSQTLRHVLQKYADKIYYVNVDSPTILQDLDTPEAYQKYAPPKEQNE